MAVSVGTGGGGAAAQTFQDVYDFTAAVPHIVLAAGQPFTIRDNAAPIGDVFVLEDTAGVDFCRVSPTTINFGTTTQRLFETTNTIAGYGGVEWYPDPFTRTTLAANNAAHLWTSTLTSTVPGGGGVGNENAPNFVSWGGEVILTEQGNLFNTQSLFNQATTVTCQGANSGPIYTMINQPLFRTGAAGGSRTGSQQNAVRSQVRIGPNIAGNFLLTSHEAFFGTCLIDATVGTAGITTARYFAAKAPTLTAGGFITTLECMHLPDIPAAGITNLRGIASEMNSGVCFRHIGSAPVQLGGNLELGSGSTFDVTLSRSAADTLRMRGDGAGDEALDWDFDPTADDTVIVTSPTGAGLQLNLDHISFGTTDTDGPNWFVLWSPPARTQNIAGEFFQVELTTGGTMTVDQANTIIGGLKVGAPTAALSGPGSVDEGSCLNVQGNVNQGAERYGLHIISNPTGGGTRNAALYVENGPSLFDGDLRVPVHTDGTRGAAGTAGRVIFNTTDGQLNIDDGTNWTLPDGTVT